MKLTFTAILLLFMACCCAKVVAQVSIEFPTRLIIRDEGLSLLTYVDKSESAPLWQVEVPKGRDLQLIGRGLVMIGTENGFQEREVASGRLVRDVQSFPGTIAARMLRNGNVLLTGVNWCEKTGIVLQEISPELKVVRRIHFPGFNYARLTRETPDSTFLVTADGVVFEGDCKGKILWQAKLQGKENPHAWQAIRIANGQTLVSGGYTGDLQLFSKEGLYLRSVRAADSNNARFYSGVEVMPNGRILTANWLGHGPGHAGEGHHLVEFDMEGKQQGSWPALPGRLSSIQGVIVLDGADIRYLHVEDADGVLRPLK